MPIDIPPPPPAIVINNNGGGVVSEFADRVDRYNREGREVRIMGSCRSACILYLGVKNVCIGPNAVLKAHEAYEQNTKIPRPDITLAMMNSIPVRVSARLLPYITPEYNPRTTLGSNELAFLGVKKCNNSWGTVEASDKRKSSKVTAQDPITKAFFKILGVDL